MDKAWTKYQVKIKYILGIIFSALAGLLIAKLGTSGAVLILAVPLGGAFFFFLFRYPKVGVYATIILSFLLPTLGRVVPGQVPFGIGVDALLILTYAAVFIQKGKRFEIDRLWNYVMLLLTIWMGYIVLQLFNPWAHSYVAWFYAMRGIALYQLLAVGLAFLVFKTRKDWYAFLNFWLGLSLLGVLWALKQEIFSLESFELRWLRQGAATTHILFGRLRIFSLYFDASTFGSAMGHMSILSGVLFLGPYSRRRKALYLITSLLTFYALMLSGTRGAFAVPVIGALLFVIMAKNRKLIIITLLLMGGGFVFLKYTPYLQGIYEINRMRSALDPNNPSFNTRVQNRERLSLYLQGKPFGTGVGSAGSWGQRFSPDTWMANFPPDGLYTRLRAETGIVGRNLFVWIWIAILLMGVWQTWNYEDPEKRNIGTAILCGLAGILVANYGNPVMTQFPTSILTFLSVGIVFNMKHWEKKTDEEKWKENKPEIKST